MGKARAGLSPWSKGYRATTARGRATAGVGFEDWAGYYDKDEWDKSPRTPKYKYYTLQRSGGDRIKVPYDDYVDYVGQKKLEGDDFTVEIEDYIFDAKFTDSCPGVGHITNLEYAPRRQILKVTFWDGAIVAYLRLPQAVYRELKFLAQSSGGMLDKRHVFRHNLGMRFWDLVRIRGTKTGHRYQYVYWQDGRPTQRTITLDRGNSSESPDSEGGVGTNNEYFEKRGTPGDPEYLKQKTQRQQDRDEWKAQEAIREATGAKNKADREEKKSWKAANARLSPEDKAISQVIQHMNTMGNKGGATRFKALSRDEQLAEAKKRGFLKNE